MTVYSSCSDFSAGQRWRESVMEERRLARAATQGIFCFTAVSGHKGVCHDIQDYTMVQQTVLLCVLLSPAASVLFTKQALPILLLLLQKVQSGLGSAILTGDVSPRLLQGKR